MDGASCWASYSYGDEFSFVVKQERYPSRNFVGHWAKPETNIAAIAQLTIPGNTSRYQYSGVESPMRIIQLPVVMRQAKANIIASAEEIQRLNFMPERITARSPVTAKGQSNTVATKAKKQRKANRKVFIMRFISCPT